jgi:hypothetical protein
MRAESRVAVYLLLFGADFRVGPGRSVLRGHDVELRVRFVEHADQRLHGLTLAADFDAWGCLIPGGQSKQPHLVAASLTVAVAVD